MVPTVINNKCEVEINTYLLCINQDIIMSPYINVVRYERDN